MLRSIYRDEEENTVSLSWVPPALLPSCIKTCQFFTALGIQRHGLKTAAPRLTSSFITKETEIQRIWSSLYEVAAAVLSGSIGNRSGLTATPLLFQDKINSIYIAKWAWGPRVSQSDIQDRERLFLFHDKTRLHWNSVIQH